MALAFHDTDNCSEFSYDGEEGTTPDSFSISELENAVTSLIELEATSRNCGNLKLVKLAEGGYHKVYEVLDNKSEILNIIARVAAPAFPKDKIESEIATLQYIASHTSIHTPRVYGWNSDSTNPVGQEYMIMEKIEGISASEVWDTLPMDLKKVTVSDVAHCILQLYALRFFTGGSLYNDAEGNTVVGPIVATPFYRALDGFVRLPNEADRYALSEYRGPFPSASGYMRSFLDAELHIFKQHRQLILDNELEGDTERLEQGIRALEKAVQLTSVYPGDVCVSEPLTTPDKSFSLSLDDFRLSNIMIDESTGHITGLIDFEGATVAPLWECAYMPRWLQDAEEWDGAYEGGSAEEKALLRYLFMQQIEAGDPTGEWVRAYEKGRPFREFTSRLTFHVAVWADSDMEEWVQERLDWAESNPGKAFYD
ncbi:hypothetical protein DFH06DRAFT_1331335 [Mycena polygramma]|nr:hypothetical protein DFH06DRAFT_1331335 [Mycena polygramma]